MVQTSPLLHCLQDGKKEASHRRLEDPEARRALACREAGQVRGTEESRSRSRSVAATGVAETGCARLGPAQGSLARGRRGRRRREIPAGLPKSEMEAKKAANAPRPSSGEDPELLEMSKAADAPQHPARTPRRRAERPKGVDARRTAMRGGQAMCGGQVARLQSPQSRDALTRSFEASRRRRGARPWDEGGGVRARRGGQGFGLFQDARLSQDARSLSLVFQTPQDERLHAARGRARQRRGSTRARFARGRCRCGGTGTSARQSRRGGPEPLPLLPAARRPAAALRARRARRRRNAPRWQGRTWKRGGELCRRNALSDCHRTNSRAPRKVERRRAKKPCLPPRREARAALPRAQARLGCSGRGAHRRRCKRALRGRRPSFARARIAPDCEPRGLARGGCRRCGEECGI
mmetsp:Transcript_26959/g.92684  ORF Transcript_26959/g.92684 Transcript_26959/m.92684 type:complete len:408 (-) Transcript_26959:310-1533(-)